MIGPAECPPLPSVSEVQFTHIPDFAGYAASDDGNIWSCWSTNGRPGRTWKHLKSSLQVGGYRIVSLQRHGKKHTRKIATLIVLAFVGPRDKDQQVCHADGTRTNDALTNLRYGTRSDNMQDMMRHGSHAYISGYWRPFRKLSDDDIITIRDLECFCAAKEVALIYSVTVGYIYNIWNFVSRATSAKGKKR